MRRAFVFLLLLASAATARAAQPALGRTEAIARAKREIDEECRRLAGGSWSDWYRDVKPFLDELSAVIDAAKPHDPTAEGTFEARSPVIEARGDWPLFEPSPKTYLAYLSLTSDPDAADSVLAVEKVSKWLAERGIDLIFVPIPKMTEVYADRVVRNHPPAGGIAAPRVRRMVRTLLERDVEVLDLLPLFLALRNDLPLYEPADPHWSDAAGLVFLEELVLRLARYDEIRAAMAEAPRYRATCRPYRPAQAAFGALDDGQAVRVLPFLERDFEVVEPLGEEPVVSDRSPVLVIGDSFLLHLPKNLAFRINLPVSEFRAAGHRVQAIGEMVREPDFLEGRKVVVWLSHHPAFGTPGAWTLPPLPPVAR